MGFYLQGAGRVTLLRDRGSEEEAMICGSRARGTGRSYLSETKAMIYGYPREGPEPSERRGKLVGAGGGVAVADGVSAAGGGQSMAMRGGDIEIGGGLMTVGSCGEGQNGDRDYCEPDSPEQEQECHHACDTAAWIPVCKCLVIKGSAVMHGSTLPGVKTDVAPVWDKVALQHSTEGGCCTFNENAMQQHDENTTFGVFSGLRKLESVCLQGFRTFGIGLERNMPQEVVVWLVQGKTKCTSLVRPGCRISAVTTYRNGNWRSEGRECSAAAPPRYPHSRGDTCGGGADCCGMRSASLVAFGAQRGWCESDSGRALSGSDSGCGSGSG